MERGRCHVYVFASIDFKSKREGFGFLYGFYFDLSKNSLPVQTLTYLVN